MNDDSGNRALAFWTKFLAIAVALTFLLPSAATVAGIGGSYRSNVDDAIEAIGPESEIIGETLLDTSRANTISQMENPIEEDLEIILYDSGVRFDPLEGLPSIPEAYRVNEDSVWIVQVYRYSPE